MRRKKFRLRTTHNVFLFHIQTLSLCYFLLLQLIVVQKVKISVRACAINVGVLKPYFVFHLFACFLCIYVSPFVRERSPSLNLVNFVKSLYGFFSCFQRPSVVAVFSPSFFRGKEHIFYEILFLFLITAWNVCTIYTCRWYSLYVTQKGLIL